MPQIPDPQSFDRFAAEYDRFASLERPAPFLVGLLPSLGRRALDAGCGSGRFSVLLADRFEEVVGIDISAPMIDIARDKSSRPNVVYHVPDLTLYDDPSGFDLIFSSTTLHHVPQLVSALTHLRTLLRPRGTVVLVDNVAPQAAVARWRHVLGALRRFPGNALRLGLDEGIWLVKYQLGHSWLDHLASDRYLNRGEFESLYGSVFPGARFAQFDYLCAMLWGNDIE